VAALRNAEEGSLNRLVLLSALVLTTCIGREGPAVKTCTTDSDCDADTICRESLCRRNGTREQVMQSDDHLFHDQSLMAPGCYYHLDMQKDGNLVIYAGPGQHVRIWRTATNDPKYAFDPSTVTSYYYAVMQSDGNLVVYDSKHLTTGWDARTHGNPGSRLVMQDDGNLVIYDLSGTPLWSSGTPGEWVGSACSSESSVTTFEQDVNRPGDDYNAISDGTVQDPHSCAARCRDDDGNPDLCKAYTWVPAGGAGPNAVCFLKNGVPKQSDAPGLFSGIIRGR
jgi:PAN domain